MTRPCMTHPSRYVLERTEHHSYDWGMFVATMGGFISAFNYTRMTLLFCYKVPPAPPLHACFGTGHSASGAVSTLDRLTDIDG